MTIFSDNLAYFKQNNSGFYNAIIDKLHNLDMNNSNVYLCTNKLGGLNLKFVKDGSEVFVHSNYDPIKEAKRWIESIDKGADIFVVFGLGFGYHIEELIKELNGNQKVFIIEPNEFVFKIFMENKHFNSLLDKRVTLLLSEDINYTAKIIFENFKESVLSKIEFCLCTGYRAIYGNMFTHIQEKIAEFVQTLHVNISTSEYFKYLWQLNCLMNLSNLNGSYNGNELKDKFKNIPAVIVSAGPSLNKNISQLNGLADKCLILAGGSSVRILQENKIKPHFSVAIDGSPLVKDIFAGYKGDDIPLVYFNRLYYEIVESYPGKKIVFIDVIDEYSKYFAKAMNISFHEFETDQTVAGINVLLASYLGCNPIVFIGQDFALTNLEFHAQGAAHMKNYVEEQKNKDEKLIEMLDIYGNQTYTLRELLTGKLTIEVRIRESINQGHLFINATEGGIGLDGCKNMFFSDVIDKYFINKTNVAQIVNDILESDKYRFKLDKSEMNNFFTSFCNNAKMLNDKALKLVSLSRNLIDFLDKEPFNNNFYSRAAKEINECQLEIEDNDFYKRIIVGAVEQTLAIHKLIMNDRINKSSDIISKNKSRLEFIINQCMQISEVCCFINNIVNTNILHKFQ